MLEAKIIHIVRIPKSGCPLRSEVGVELAGKQYEGMSEVMKLFSISLKVQYIFVKISSSSTLTYHLCISLYVNSTSRMEKKQIRKLKAHINIFYIYHNEMSYHEILVPNSCIKEYHQTFRKYIIPIYVDYFRERSREIALTHFRRPA